MSHHQTHNHLVRRVHEPSPNTQKSLYQLNLFSPAHSTKDFFHKIIQNRFIFTHWSCKTADKFTHTLQMNICMVLWMHIVCRVKDIFLTVCFERLSRNILMWFAMRYLVLALMTVNQLCFYDSKPCTTYSLTTQWSKWQFFDKMYSTKQSQLI